MYCSESGPSNLYLARSCFSMCSGNFRSRSNGPPGIRWTRKKVIVMTQKRMTIKPRTLFATNLSMRSGDQESGVKRSGVVEHWSIGLSGSAIYLWLFITLNPVPKAFRARRRLERLPGIKIPGKSYTPSGEIPSRADQYSHYSSAPLLRDADPPAHQISALLVLHH